MYGRQGIELCHLIETFALPTHTQATLRIRDIIATAKKLCQAVSLWNLLRAYLVEILITHTYWQIKLTQADIMMGFWQEW